MERSASNRRIVSIVLFVLAVLLIVIGLVSEFGTTGLLLGLASAIVGLVFYRRGK